MSKPGRFWLLFVRDLLAGSAFAQIALGHPARAAATFLVAWVLTQWVREESSS